MALNWVTVMFNFLSSVITFVLWVQNFQSLKESEMLPKILKSAKAKGQYDEIID